MAVDPSRDRALLLFYMLKELPASCIRLPPQTPLESIDFEKIDVDRLIASLLSGDPIDLSRNVRSHLDRFSLASALQRLKSSKGAGSQSLFSSFGADAQAGGGSSAPGSSRPAGGRRVIGSPPFECALEEPVLATAAYELVLLMGTPPVQSLPLPCQTTLRLLRAQLGLTPQSCAHLAKDLIIDRPAAIPAGLLAPLLTASPITHGVTEPTSPSPPAAPASSSPAASPQASPTAPQQAAREGPEPSACPPPLPASSPTCPPPSDRPSDPPVATRPADGTPSAPSEPEQQHGGKSPREEPQSTDVAPSPTPAPAADPSGPAQPDFPPPSGQAATPPGPAPPHSPCPSRAAAAPTAAPAVPAWVYASPFYRLLLLATRRPAEFARPEEYQAWTQRQLDTLQAALLVLLDEWDQLAPPDPQPPEGSPAVEPVGSANPVPMEGGGGAPAASLSLPQPAAPLGLGDPSTGPTTKGGPPPVPPPPPPPCGQQQLDHTEPGSAPATPVAAPPQVAPATGLPSCAALADLVRDLCQRLGALSPEEEGFRALLVRLGELMCDLSAEIGARCPSFLARPTGPALLEGLAGPPPEAPARTPFRYPRRLGVAFCQALYLASFDNIPGAQPLPNRAELGRNPRPHPGCPSGALCGGPPKRVRQPPAYLWALGQLALHQDVSALLFAEFCRATRRLVCQAAAVLGVALQALTAPGPYVPPAEDGPLEALTADPEQIQCELLAATIFPLYLTMREQLSNYRQFFQHSPDRMAQVLQLFLLMVQVLPV
ncbi:hypothetical protein PAPYR_222 [Paratrimastix pyriformis]|uniref:Uncharacterized protein n=1 Tax=Paratrimastix pyriformis TaxID=342808 RepID=A0ABQ8UV62_9EUKA|nr:hypothetical protein PAPYR_222 [Paratrimastix pyriformis]